MQEIFETDRKPCTLTVGIQSYRPETVLRFQVLDNLEPITYYLNHLGQLYNGNVNGYNFNGYREFDLYLPQSPGKSCVNIFNVNNGNFLDGRDNSFKILGWKKKDTVPTRSIWITKQDAEFIKFAKFFAENASALSATIMVNGKSRPSVYRSDCCNFLIDYHDIITDNQTGQIVDTPARIGNETGIIEVSKTSFLNYTVQMRLVILLHEYSHKYKNPKNGKAIEDESAADLAALNMYLALGYSPLEAENAFLVVFKNADTPQNRYRFKVLHDYIKQHINGQLSEYAKSIKSAA